MFTEEEKGKNMKVIDITPYLETRAKKELKPVIQTVQENILPKVEAKIEKPTTLKQKVVDYMDLPNTFGKLDLKYVNMNSDELATLSPLNLARRFKTEVKDGIADWNDTFPKDGELGANVTAMKFSRYYKPLRQLDDEQTEFFCQRAFGQNDIQCLKKSAENNTIIRVFVNLLETKLGKNLDDLYKN